MASSITSSAAISQEISSIDQSLLFEIAIFAVTVVLTVALRDRKRKVKQERKLSKANVAGRLTSAEPFADRGSEKDTSSGRSPVLKQMAGAIDNIVSLMDATPTLRDLGSIIEAYRKLNVDSKRKLLPQALALSGRSTERFYNVMIQVATRLSQVEMLDSILEDMSQAGIVGTLDIYENAMKLLASQKKYDMALKVYDKLAAAGLEPSYVTWSCLVVFAAEVEDYDRAVSFFNKLSLVTTPSVRAYMTILRVHGKRNDWPAAVAIFQDMRERSVAIDAPLLNLILATGVAVNEVEGCERLLAEAETMSPPVPDTVSYNTLVKGYAQRNDAESSLKTVYKMQERGLKCTSITFNTALDAAFRATLPSVALSILSSMTKDNIQPDKFTCTILIKGLSMRRNRTHDVIQKCLAIANDSKSNIHHTLRSKLQQVAEEASTKISSNSKQPTYTPPWRKSRIEQKA